MWIWEKREESKNVNKNIMWPSLFTNRFLFQIFHDFNFLELVLRRLAVLLLSDFLNKKILSVAFFELIKLYLKVIRSTLKKSVDAKVSRVQLSGIPWMCATFLLFLRKRDILWWKKKTLVCIHVPFTLSLPRVIMSEFLYTIEVQHQADMNKEKYQLGGFSAHPIPNSQN